MSKSAVVNTEVHPSTHVPYINYSPNGPVVNFINLETGTREWASILKKKSYPKKDFIELVTKFISVSVEPYLDILDEVWEKA